MNNQVAKRYACDRCREQKLRCDRSDSQLGDEPCGRCVRAGTRCTMSAGRPLGRPSVQKSQVRRADRVHGHANGTKTSNSNLMSNARRTSTFRDALSMSSQSALTQSETVVESPSSPLSAMLFANNPLSFDVMTDVLNGPVSSVTCSLPMASRILEFNTNDQHFPNMFGDVEDAECTGHENMNGHVTSDPRSWASSEIDDDYDDIVVDNIDDDGDDDGDAGNDLKKRVTWAHMRNTRSHWTTALTDILGHIALQLAELRDHFREPHSIRHSREQVLEPDALLLCDEGTVRLGSWDKIFSITTRFAMVLQAMAPPRCTTGITQPAYAPPTLASTLLFLSTYVQLGELFDVVLHCINRYLQEPQQKTNAVTQVAPSGSRLALKQTVGLHILMMTQFVENQLHEIEHLLGIPADCRMWSTKESYGGILDQDTLSGFARDVVQQTQGPFRSLKRGIDGVRRRIA